MQNDSTVQAENIIKTTAYTLLGITLAIGIPFYVSGHTSATSSANSAALTANSNPT